MDQEDRISLLPDCVLGSIVSLLSVKNAAATMALSRRWRPLWPSLPLELDVVDHSPGAGRLISGALSSNGAVRIRRFRVDTLKDETTRPWLQALEGRRVDGSLIIRFSQEGPRPVLPPYLLRASTGAGTGAALRRLELRWCVLHPRTTDGPGTFPRLVVLHLSSVVIGDAGDSGLHRLIAGCPALRELHLIGVHELRRFVPCSGTLLRVTIGAPHVPIREISFRGTPNLQSLQIWHADIWQLYPAIINQDVMPCKHRTSVGIALTALDAPCFRIMPKRSIPIVTTLKLNMKFSNSEELTKVAHILSLFPSLQALHIWCYYFFRSNKDKKATGQWQLPAADTIICLSKHLKNVKLIEYCGSEKEVGFARFILAGAKSLTNMQIFHHAATNWSDHDINNHKDQICKGGKASSKAQVTFRKSNNSEKSLRKAYSSVYRAPIV